jgi:predicted  nucleic acid-binding Zn-ribbon protein
MKDLLQNLLKLQALEFDGTISKADEKEIAGLRAGIPAPILGHYDRMRARKKKGVAIVRNQVCTGCHMRLPMGTIMTLMHNTDIQLCDCGRYLYLPPATPEEPQEQSSEVKLVKKPKKRKVAATAA